MAGMDLERLGGHYNSSKRAWQRRWKRSGNVQEMLRKIAELDNRLNQGNWREQGVREDSQSCDLCTRTDIRVIQRQV